jgi:hypothetical protein
MENRAFDGCVLGMRFWRDSFVHAGTGCGMGTGRSRYRYAEQVSIPVPSEAAELAAEFATTGGVTRCPSRFAAAPTREHLDQFHVGGIDAFPIVIRKAAYRRFPRSAWD